jgi:hypothetical protein
MRSDDHYTSLTCSDLALDQEKLNTEYAEAVEEFLGLLSHYFGRVQVQTALGMKLEGSLKSALHSFAQGIANVFSSAYVTEALAKSRMATATMFEALAAGAHVAAGADRRGEGAGDVAGALALIAAVEGRPEVLNLQREEAEGGTSRRQRNT